MFVQVHQPKKMIGGDNKGSSGKIIDYLEKENNGKEDSNQENFFNHSSDTISAQDAVAMIDSNNKNLGKGDCKFYMLTINPSDKEQAHLIEKVTGRKVENLHELSKEEKHKVFLEVKNYSNQVMREYALNFERDNVTTEKDLVYVAKIEENRTYKFHSIEVKHNEQIKSQQQKLKSELKNSNPDQAKLIDKKIAKLESQLLKTKAGLIIGKGVAKDGLNLHVHVVVSRNNVHQNTKLSPLSNSRGGYQMLNGKEVKQGFNHERFKARSGQRFNMMYNYKATANEQYVSRDMRKNQSLIMGQLKSQLDVSRNVKSKVKGVASVMLTNNMVNEERRMINTTVQAAKTLVHAVVSPKSAVISVAKQIASKILSNAKFNG